MTITGSSTISAPALPALQREARSDVQSQRPRALTTRFADFWLLGGASLLVWLVMFAVQGFRAAWAIDQHFKNLTVTTASLSLLVNYPHFLVSYKLAYTRGRAFITTPLVAAARRSSVARRDVCVRVRVLRRARVAGCRWSRCMSRDLTGVGNNARVFSGPRLGDLLFALTFNVMIFTVGWHYTKQVFGCMMVYALLRPVHAVAAPADDDEVRAAQHLVAELRTGQRGGSRRTTSRSSSTTRSTCLTSSCRSPRSSLRREFVLVAYEVFWKNYKERGQVPSVNMVVPFVALYVWWLPITRQYEFYFLLTPFFHSLQYLAFVYKMEDTRLRGLEASGDPRNGSRVCDRRRRLAGVRVRSERGRHCARHVQRLADVLLLHRGDVVHQHPPLLHRQRPLALQGS